MISIGCRSQRPTPLKEELSAPIVFDGRNMYSPELLAEKGFAYFCIGRK